MKTYYKISLVINLVFKLYHWIKIVNKFTVDNVSLYYFNLHILNIDLIDYVRYDNNNKYTFFYIRLINS